MYSRITSLKVVRVAFVLVLVSAGNAFAAGTTTTNPTTTRTAMQETVKKFRGVVVKRDADSFTMSETQGGPQTTVLLTANTEL
jgi:hypothetical protein